LSEPDEARTPQAGDRSVTVLTAETAFDGYFQIIRYRLRHALFDGGESGIIQREVFERGHAVAVLPYDPVRDEVVLVEQFRAGALEVPIDDAPDPWLLEIVAGIVEPGEALAEVAKREAAEEAGLALLDLQPVCRYFVSPGGTSETCALYVARIDSSRAGGVHGGAEESEDIKVHVVAVDTALAWLEAGRIRAATPIIALQWLALHRDELKRRWRD
jgi:ADP-ribose pyrophosphatase